MIISEITTKTNQEKFEALKTLKLPLGHFVIIGSGPLGIRNLRHISDIDLLISPELWATLSELYGTTIQNNQEKIVLLDGLVEAFLVKPEEAKMVEHPEIIDSLPFQPLEEVVNFKRKWGRPKDFQDITLIENFLEINKFKN